MKIKTLKDIDYWLTNELFCEQGKKRFKWKEEKHLIDIEKLKAEVVRWVKEELKYNEDEVREMKLVGQEQIERWMERLDILEEDLK